MPQVLDVIGNEGMYMGQKFDEADMHIVCPWHGYEYHLTDGAHVCDPRIRLQKFRRRGAQRRGLCRNLTPPNRRGCPSSRASSPRPVSEAMDANRLADIPDDALGQVIRPRSSAPMPPRRRRASRRRLSRATCGVTVTDVMIGCTAHARGARARIVFELGLWQSWTTPSAQAQAPRRPTPKRSDLLTRGSRGMDTVRLPRPSPSRSSTPRRCCARRRAGDRSASYEDFFIVDVDSHHYETEAFKEIAEVHRGSGAAPRGQVPGHARGGITSATARIRRWPAASPAIRSARTRRCPPTPHRDITLMRALDGCDRRRHGGACSRRRCSTSPNCPRIEVEVALARAYNRWLCDNILDKEPRIKSMLYLPFHDPEACYQMIEEFGDTQGRRRLHGDGDALQGATTTTPT